MIQTRWGKITKRIAERCEEHQIERILSELDGILQDMHDCDEFGTEGQCDPRGDFREGEYSVWDMEDFD